MESGNLDEARRMSKKAVDIVDVLVKHGGGTRAGKIFMKLAGFDCGPCRLPIAPCSRRNLPRLVKNSEKTDFFKYTAV